MIEFLTYIYPSTSIKNKGLLNKVRFYSAARLLVRSFANIALPVYFKIENFLTDKYRLKNDGTERLIVSFTSFPERIDKVWLVVETILRQSVKPEKLILWLSKEQFSSLNELPTELLKQQGRGLEIYLCEDDLRSHKKYYYTMVMYPSYDFITIDDDFFYPSKMIENLLCNRDAQKIIAHRAFQLKFFDDDIAPYSDWTLMPDKVCSSTTTFATSGGGTYFPAGALHADTIDKEIFMKYSSLADDIWLYLMAVINDTETLKTDFSPVYLPILIKNNVTLSSVNVGEKMNDKQLHDLIFLYKELRKLDIKKKLFRSRSEFQETFCK